jgi:hypothetical protein
MQSGESFRALITSLETCFAFSSHNTHPFVLAAAGAEQDQCQFSGCFNKLRFQPQPVRTALETPHRELTKRTVTGCLGRLIILSPLKITRRIHPGILFSRLDKGCPTEG